MTDIQDKKSEVRELRVERKRRRQKKVQIECVDICVDFFECCDWVNEWMDGVLPPDDLVCKPLKFFFQLWFLNEYLQQDKFYLYIWMTHILFAIWWNVLIFMNEIRYSMSRHGAEWSVDIMSNQTAMTSSWEIYVCTNTHKHTLPSFIHFLTNLFIC